MYIIHINQIMNHTYKTLDFSHKRSNLQNQMSQTLPSPQFRGDFFCPSQGRNSLSNFPCDICCLFDSSQKFLGDIQWPLPYSQYHFFPEIKTLFLSIELIGQLQQRRGRDLWHGGLGNSLLKIVNKNTQKPAHNVICWEKSWVFFSCSLFWSQKGPQHNQVVWCIFFAVLCFCSKGQFRKQESLAGKTCWKMLKEEKSKRKRNKQIRGSRVFGYFWTSNLYNPKLLSEISEGGPWNSCL